MKRTQSKGRSTHMRKKAVSTAGTIIRLACAALLVFAALPLAFGSSSAPKAPSKIGDGGGQPFSMPRVKAL